MDFEKELKSLVKEGSRINIDELVIKEDTDLINDLGYDSLSLIKLIVEIEKKFDFEVDDIDLINSITYGSLVCICKNNLSK